MSGPRPPRRLQSALSIVVASTLLAALVATIVTFVLIHVLASPSGLPGRLALDRLFRSDDAIFGSIELEGELPGISSEVTYFVPVESGLPLSARVVVPGLVPVRFGRLPTGVPVMLKLASRGVVLFHETVVLSPGQTLKRRLRPDDLARTIAVNTSPPGAAVWLDDVVQGRTPLVLTLKPRRLASTIQVGDETPYRVTVADIFENEMTHLEVVFVASVAQGVNLGKGPATTGSRQRKASRSLRGTSGSPRTSPEPAPDEGRSAGQEVSGSGKILESSSHADPRPEVPTILSGAAVDVDIVADRAGLDIRLDEQWIGRTPFHGALPGGKHLISFYNPGVDRWHSFPVDVPDNGFRMRIDSRRLEVSINGRQYTLE